MKKWQELSKTEKILYGVGALAGAIGIGYLVYYAISKLKPSGSDVMAGQSDYDSAMKQALAAFNKKDFALAKQELNIALSIKPKDPTATLQLESVNEAIFASGSSTSGSGGTGSGSGGTGSGSGSGSGGGGTGTILPNDGVSCGTIKTGHDGNYDYVRCANIWYTRSKDNPASASVKGTIPNWRSLASNQVATGILNTAYPNG